MVAFQDRIHKLPPISTQIFAHLCEVLTTIYCEVYRSKQTDLKGNYESGAAS